MVVWVRLLLGYHWLTAGWHKITGDKPFDATGFLKGAIANPVADKTTGEAVYPTYLAFLEHFALPNVKLINILIPWGELLVGLGLILGTLTVTAAFFGLLMNFMFVFAGTVSTNPWLMLLGMLVMALGFWAYCIAVSLARVRVVMLEREPHAAWARQAVGEMA